MLTPEQIESIALYASKSKVELYTPMINATMERYEINTPLRQAHFLAQIIHESGSFNYTTELASGEAYEGRKDLGNTQAGDGVKFKGRGFIQLTGRANYAAYGNAINEDLIINPEYVATQFPADVSGWFWHTHSLNALADADNVLAVTKVINGGTNGLTERTYYLNRAKNVLINQTA